MSDIDVTFNAYIGTFRANQPGRLTISDFDKNWYGSFWA